VIIDFMLTNITITATETIIVFVDILLEIRAAIGAANALPNIRPETACQ
jgi:hypothetical protein